MNDLEWESEMLAALRDVRAASDGLRRARNGRGDIEDTRRLIRAGGPRLGMTRRCLAGLELELPYAEDALIAGDVAAARIVMSSVVAIADRLPETEWALGVNSGSNSALGYLRSVSARINALPLLRKPQAARRRARRARLDMLAAFMASRGGPPVTYREYCRLTGCTSAVAATDMDIAALEGWCRLSGSVAFPAY